MDSNGGYAALNYLVTSSISLRTSPYDEIVYVPLSMPHWEGSWDVSKNFQEVNTPKYTKLTFSR